MGTEGFAHGMTPNQLKRISELKKTNKEFKEILFQKELKPYNFYTLQELEQVVVLFFMKNTTTKDCMHRFVVCHPTFFRMLE